MGWDDDGGREISLYASKHLPPFDGLVVDSAIVPPFVVCRWIRMIATVEGRAVHDWIEQKIIRASCRHAIENGIIFTRGLTSISVQPSRLARFRYFQQRRDV